MKRVYIAGPMSGLPEFNYPAFHARAQKLREQGYHVENPAENPEPPCKSWQGYMRLALAQLVTCDVMDMLPGWSQSKGATIEHNLGQALEMEIWTDGCQPANTKTLMNRHYMVTLGWPSRDLSPNARVNWRTKADATKKYRAAAGWAALDAKLPRFATAGVERVDVGLAFYPPAKHRYDRDNLVAIVKSGLDGLSEHMRIDDHRFYPQAPQLMPPDKERGACVVVTLDVYSEFEGV